MPHYKVTMHIELEFEAADMEAAEQATHTAYAGMLDGAYAAKAGVYDVAFIDQELILAANSDELDAKSKQQPYTRK